MRRSEGEEQGGGKEKKQKENEQQKRRSRRSRSNRARRDKLVNSFVIAGCCKYTRLNSRVCYKKEEFMGYDSGV